MCIRIIFFILFDFTLSSTRCNTDHRTLQIDGDRARRQGEDERDLSHVKLVHVVISSTYRKLAGTEPWSHALKLEGDRRVGGSHKLCAKRIGNRCMCQLDARMCDMRYSRESRIQIR